MHDDKVNFELFNDMIGNKIDEFEFITLRLDMILFNVYDINGNDLTDKYIEHKMILNLLKMKKRKMYHYI